MKNVLLRNSNLHRAQRVPLLWSLLCLVPFAFFLGCSSSYTARTQAFHDSYLQNNLVQADHELNKLLAEETGEEIQAIAKHNGLSLDASQGDVPLFLLHKGIIQFTLGNIDLASKLLRKARDELDRRFETGNAAFFASTLSDDTALAYIGADYEHIMVRVMLALYDLIRYSGATSGDAYAYALQVGEKQEALLSSPLGEDLGYKPREHYRRVGIGAYLQGLLSEATNAPDEAAKIYQRLQNYEPNFELGKQAFQRAENGSYAPAGHGVLHLFYFAGQAPRLVEGTSEATEQALLIAELASAFILDSPVPILQAPVPVPKLQIQDHNPAQLQVQIGQESFFTETLLDVNQVATQQLEVMMPMILARALLRRAVKTTLTTAAGKIGRNAFEEDEIEGHLIELGAGIVNLIWTSTESADTRSWSSLPASIQVARIELPAGQHRLVLGDGTSQEIDIQAATDSYLMMLRPNLRLQGTVFLDTFSQPQNK